MQERGLKFLCIYLIVNICKSLLMQERGLKCRIYSALFKLKKSLLMQERGLKFLGIRHMVI